MWPSYSNFASSFISIILLIFPLFVPDLIFPAYSPDCLTLQTFKSASLNTFLVLSIGACIPTTLELIIDVATAITLNDFNSKKAQIFLRFSIFGTYLIPDCLFYFIVFPDRDIYSFWVIFNLREVLIITVLSWIAEKYIRESGTISFVAPLLHLAILLRFFSFQLFSFGSVLSIMSMIFFLIGGFLSFVALLRFFSSVDSISVTDIVGYSLVFILVTIPIGMLTYAALCHDQDIKNFDAFSMIGTVRP